MGALPSTHSRVNSASYRNHLITGTGLRDGVTYFTFKDSTTLLHYHLLLLPCLLLCFVQGCVCVCVRTLVTVIRVRCVSDFGVCRGDLDPRG